MSKYIEALKEKRQIALNEIVKCDLVLSEYSSERTTSDCLVRKIRLKGEVEAYDEAIAAYEKLESRFRITYPARGGEQIDGDVG